MLVCATDPLKHLLRKAAILNKDSDGSLMRKWQIVTLIACDLCSRSAAALSDRIAPQDRDSGVRQWERYTRSRHPIQLHPRLPAEPILPRQTIESAGAQRRSQIEIASIKPRTTAFGPKRALRLRMQRVPPRATVWPPADTPTTSIAG